MMDTAELVKLCGSLTLRDEASEVLVSDVVHKRVEAIATNCLIGKILTRQVIPKEVFMKNFLAIWKNVTGVKVEFLEKNIFLFRFASAQDRRRILLLGPWHFDRALVVLTLLLGNSDLIVQCFNKVAFWVQIYNVPLLYMSKEMA